MPGVPGQPALTELQPACQPVWLQLKDDATAEGDKFIQTVVDNIPKAAGKDVSGWLGWAAGVVSGWLPCPALRVGENGWARITSTAGLA